MFSLKGVLRAESQEKILIYLLARDKGYGLGIAEFFNSPANPIQKQLVRLEEDGVIVSRAVGKIREYQLNPRYAFYTPLKELLKAALETYSDELKSDLLIERTRPRKAEKKLRVHKR